ncbi:helix-turn-helix transcriptional regulator [Fusobacterium sp. SYSU M8D902]|uniref:helix-turn-helix domain-containing protein n=1 Tax=Fusobacterium sp. SYSU M8D902 TaxID=3159562 RepID=UPI0032E3CF60
MELKNYYKNKIEIGKILKNLRKEKKISLAKLSVLSGINIADIYKIETGEKLKINPFHLKILSEILKFDYKILYKKIGFLEETDFLKKEDIMKIINMTSIEKEKLKEKLIISEDEKDIVSIRDIHSQVLKEDE